MAFMQDASQPSFGLLPILLYMKSFAREVSPQPTMYKAFTVKNIYRHGSFIYPVLPTPATFGVKGSMKC